jgi:hypothetical protein
VGVTVDNENLIQNAISRVGSGRAFSMPRSGKNRFAPNATVKQRDWMLENALLFGVMQSSSLNEPGHPNPKTIIGLS